MLIKKIKLNNIRSYVDEEINFPVGSILLSGDVGSGKSTILLAVEFALFGITNEISGGSLLRNGENKGYAELHFTIDGKDVIIRRGLKRSSQVLQDSGSIIINNVRKELTATELKQKILEMLNYPKNLLTKSKSLVYRYTVYTPQEEMKHILLGKKDERLEILRKVFGIDKYKRIRDNTKIFLDEIKNRIKEFSGMVSDMGDKKEQLRIKENEQGTLLKRVNEVTPKLSETNSLIEEKSSKIILVEKDIKILENLKKEIEINNLKLQHNKEIIEVNNKKINRLRDELSNFSEISSSKLNELNNISLDELKKNLEIIEKELNEINLKRREAETSKRNSDDLIKKINSMNNCPLCKQNVVATHKHDISESETEKINTLNKQIQLHSKSEEDIKIKLNNARLNYDKTQNRKNELELLRYKLSEKEKKQNELNSLIEVNSVLDKSNNEIDQKLGSIKNKIKSIELSEPEFDKLKKELDELKLRDKELSVEKGKLISKNDEISYEVDLLKKEIESKLKIQININYFY